MSHISSCLNLHCSPLTVAFMPLTRYRSQDALMCFLMGCSQEFHNNLRAARQSIQPSRNSSCPPSVVVADGPVFCSQPFLVRTFILFISPRSLSTSLPDSSNSPMGVFPEEEEEGRENTRAISSARHSPGDRSRPLSLSLLPGIFMADRSENGIMGGPD